MEEVELKEVAKEVEEKVEEKEEEEIQRRSTACSE
jgi:hypothetical protein